MNIPQAHKRQVLSALFRVATAAADGMPACQRADVYEGIALAAEGHDPELFQLASEIANHLREADVKQLTFRQILQ